MEKETSSSGNISGASLLSQNVYCVCFPRRDSVEVLHGELAAARRRFFTGGRRAVKVGRHEIVRGFDGNLRGKLSRWSFYWKKIALGVSGQKGVALEEAFDQKDGYVLVNRDFRGVIVSRSFFNREHAWQKSEYYEPWDSGTARVMFKPGSMENTVERYDWDSDKKLYRSVILYPAPYQAGSAEQALVNARFGEPQLILSLEGGLFCYCPRKEAEERAKALDEISSGTMVLMPAWEIKDGAFQGDEGEEETAVTFTSLEEYARIETGKTPAPASPLPVPVQAEDSPEPDFTPSEEPVQADELNLEVILADVRQNHAVEPVMESEHISPLPHAGREDEQKPPQRAEVENPHRPSMGMDDAAILSAARQAGGVEPPRRAEHGALSTEDTSILAAARQASGMVMEDTPGHFSAERTRQTDRQHHTRKTESAAPRHAGAGQQPPPPPAQRPRKPVPSAGSDRMRAGKLSGRGRAEQPGGLTAYEGEYKDGKRQGFGSHYYKNGDLSYAGFWREDKKDGLGVSFREGDHVLHISRWEQGRPGQMVSLFDREGGLRYGGRIINGKKEGAGVSISSTDGSVLVTRWADGQNTGLASAFDQEGNLLYYGSWKNGRRHGHGTEFDKSGAIVFDGEWRDDRYYNGILYQKPADDPQPADTEYTEPDWDM